MQKIYKKFKNYQINPIKIRFKSKYYFPSINCPQIVLKFINFQKTQNTLLFPSKSPQCQKKPLKPPKQDQPKKVPPSHIFQFIY